MIDMPTLIQMQIQRAMGVRSQLDPPAIDARAQSVRQALDAQINERLALIASGAPQ